MLPDLESRRHRPTRARAIIRRRAAVYSLLLYALPLVNAAPPAGEFATAVLRLGAIGTNSRGAVEDPPALH